MAYDQKYRKRTLEYWHEGHTFRETKEVFKVTIDTIQKWEKRLREEGTLSKTPVIVI